MSYWGRCLSYGEGITYWPIVEILREAAGITPRRRRGGDRGEARRAPRQPGNVGPGRAADDGGRVSNLAGVATTPLGTYSADEIGQAELHWGIRRVLELRAERRPTVVVLEDLHWAEPTLLELISFVGESGVGVPLLVLGTADPRRPTQGRRSSSPTRSGGYSSSTRSSGHESASLIAELVRGGPLSCPSRSCSRRPAATRSSSRRPSACSPRRGPRPTARSRSRAVEPAGADRLAPRPARPGWKSASRRTRP